MKIKSNILCDFVRKASIEGTINTIDMEFTKNGLKSSVKSVDNLSATTTFLKAEAFENYEEMDKLFIKNTLTFINYLKSFKGDITLERINDSVLNIFNDEREVQVILCAESIFDNGLDKPFDNKAEISINLNKTDIAQAMKDISSYGEGRAIVELADKQLSFIIGDKTSDMFKNKIQTGVEGEARVIINNIIIKTLSTIDDDFTLWLKSDYPISITEETPLFQYSCIIAPIVENDKI